VFESCDALEATVSNELTTTTTKQLRERRRQIGATIKPRDKPDHEVVGIALHVAVDPDRQLSAAERAAPRCAACSPHLQLLLAV